MIRSRFSTVLAVMLPLGFSALLCGKAQGQAQQLLQGRGTSLGKIEAAPNQDWKGAEVTFFSRPYLGCFEVGEPDLVRVRVGDKGRFQARLLRGRVYDVWAIQKKKEGRYWLTKTASNIVVGRLVQLVPIKSEQMELRLRLLGQGRWPGRGPFQVDVLARNKQVLSLGLELDDKGETVLPPMPSSSVTVSVRAADGQYLLSKNVQLQSSSRKSIPGQIESARKRWATEKKKREEDAKKKREELAKKTEAPKAQAPEEKKGEKKGAKKDKKKKPPPIPKEPFPEYLEGDIPGPDVEQLVLPRAFTARFLVQDESEQPLEGIEVIQVIGDSRLGRSPVLGKTGKDGRVDLVVPQPWTGYGAPRAKPNLNFLFTGEEWGRIQDGWNSYQRGQKKPLDNQEVVARRSEVRKVQMSPGFVIKGRVHWRKGEPAKGYPVVVGMPALVSYGPGSWGTSSQRSFVLRTDENGEFSIPGWHQNLYGGTLSLWVDGKELARRFSLAMEVPDSLIQPFPYLNLWGQSGEMSLEDVFLSEMRIAQIEVRTAEGEQASFAEVAASLSQSMNWNSFDRDPAYYRVADRRGRAIILVPSSQRNLFVRLPGKGYFFGGMQIPEGKISTPLKAYPQLQPFAQVTGRVVDEKGRPISGADLSIRSTSMMGGGPDINIIYNLNYRLLRGKSDAQGYFALEFIPHPNLQFGIGVRARVEGKYYNAPDMIQISNQPLSGLEVELPVNLAVARKEAKERAEKNAKTAVKDAGKAVTTAVGGAGAGIGNMFRGILERAKALADEKEAAKKAAAKKAAAKKGAAKKAAADPKSEPKKSEHKSVTKGSSA